MYFKAKNNSFDQVPLTKIIFSHVPKLPGTSARARFMFICSFTMNLLIIVTNKTNIYVANFDS